MNDPIFFPKLNPCPFCGGEVLMDSDQKGFSVSCRNEKCLSPAKKVVYGTPQAALKAWNKGNGIKGKIRSLFKSVVCWCSNGWRTDNQ